MTDQSTLPACQLTPQREIFCTEYAHGASGKDAAIAANYSAKSATSKASHLLKEPEIEARIAEIRAETRKDARLTVQDHVKDLKTLTDEARTAKQLGAAVSATKAQGQVCGLYEPGGVDEASRVPTEDIIHMLACGREWAEAALNKLFGGDFDGFEGELRAYFSNVLGVKLIEADADEG